ncbi:nucleotide-binding alpha-beta plait domain-containing protein [Tanacetum coccineum]
MDSQRSKEDDVHKISTSVFITNFPDMFSAKDLFNTCKQYGHVVDAYIPIKRTKARKRFQRTPLSNESTQVKNKFKGNRSSTNEYNKEKGVNGVANSYVYVVKGRPQSVNMEIESTPALILDDECLNLKDLSNSLLGRVKEFASLSNLKMVLTTEGFDSIKIKYMGEFWVLLEFASEASKNLFQSNVGGGLKVEDIISLGGERDVEEVPETELEERLHNQNLEEASTGQKDKHSEDPFNLYPLLNKKSNVIDRGNNSDYSLKFPPGYTPTDDKEEHYKKGEESKKESGDYSQGHHEEELNNGIKDKCSNKGSKEDVAESVCSGHFKKSETPRTCGSILHLMDELVKVGQTMRYNMEGCMKNMAEIIESQGVNDVYRRIFCR